MNWNELTMAQKNELMKTYIRNGVTSLDDMRSHFNTYANGGPKKTFQEWSQAMKSKYPWLELDSNKAGYDYERYFNENYEDAIARLNEAEARHFTDKYKLPNHPTFSNESIYSQGPSIGGSWTRDGRFIPSVINIQQHPNIYRESRPYNESDVYGREFATGGDTQPDNPPKGVMTRLKEKIIENKINRAINDLGIEELRRRLYENIDPHRSYNHALRDFNKAVKNKKASELLIEDNSKSNGWLTPNQINIADETFAQYLQIPENNRHTTLRLQESNYKPTKSNNNATYYKLPLEDKDIQNLIAERFSSDYHYSALRREWTKIPHPLKVGENKLSNILVAYNLGTHTVGRGYDKDKGEYVSYYDLWDLNPLHIRGGGEDLSHGVGKPVELYDRIYLDDYYGLNTKGIYLPEVIIKP